ncbi:hypothetical protein H5410_014367, partial [Solanum commersonii]
EQIIYYTFSNVFLVVPLLPCVPVVTCFIINLHFVQVTIVFSTFCTKNLHTKDLLTRIMVFEKVCKEGLHLVSSHDLFHFRKLNSIGRGGKILELELLPPPLLFFLFDISLLPLFLSKFMFKFKIINIMKNKQDNITKIIK